MTCPVLDSAGTPVSRGVSAIADFEGNRQITLPLWMGRIALHSGAGAGLTSRSLTETGGLETTTLAIANLPPHQHGYITHANLLVVNGTGADPNMWQADAVGITTDGSEHGLAGTPANTMPPFSVITNIIKL